MEKILKEIIDLAGNIAYSLTGKGNLHLQGIKNPYMELDILTNDSGLNYIANILERDVDFTSGYAKLVTMLSGKVVNFISCDNNPNQAENFLKESILFNYKNLHIPCQSLAVEKQKLELDAENNEKLIKLIEEELKKREKIRVYIIHGYAVTPEDNWFPWLRNELTKYGYTVTSPYMPLPITPLLSEWLDHLQNTIKKPDQNTYLIGHSLGSATILKYLEKISKGKLLGGVVLVSCFLEANPIKEMDNFFQKAVNFAKIKERAKRFTCIISDDDPHIPLKIGETIKQELGAKIVVCPNGGHLNQKSGYTKLPEALDALQEMIKKA